VVPERKARAGSNIAETTGNPVREQL